jgi:hypothetical protein
MLPKGPAVIFLQGRELRSALDLPNGSLAIDDNDGRRVVLDLKAMKFVATQLRRIERELALGRDLSAPLVTTDEMARLRGTQECPAAAAVALDPHFRRGFSGDHR